MKRLAMVLLVLGTSACGSQGTSSQAASQCSTQMPGKVSLPADDAVHPSAPMEWWYWTGHLKATDGRWFGFEHVFFTGKDRGTVGTIVHHAITDVSAKKHVYVENLALGGPSVVPNGFNLKIKDDTAVGGNGTDHIHGSASGYTLDLALNAVKRPTLQLGNGYTNYSVGGYTYYYSRERMKAQGTLQVGSQTLNVSGTAWFDHQWGDLAPVLTSGWVWMALQLDDNSEIMLFFEKTKSGLTMAGGSHTDGGCATKQLTASDVSLTSTGTWTSSTTHCTYPMGWTLSVDGQKFTLTPVLDDQEIVSSMVPKYWEGATTVSGDVSGRAYVELVGYCP